MFFQNKIQKTLIRILTYSLSLILTTNIYSIEKKKVLVMDFINIENNPSYQYLEESITTTVKSMLRKRYVYEEIEKSKWLSVADVNYQFREDFHTKSAGMLIGLLTKQDVVIVSGFVINNEPDKKNPGTKEESVSQIRTKVRILNMADKKAISEFEVVGYADNRLFTSVSDIAERISEEMKDVLPNKDDWVKKNLADKKAQVPFFSSPSLSLDIGGLFYLGGLAPYMTPEQPVIFLSMTGALPIIHSRLQYLLDLGYFRHTLNQDDLPELSDFTVNANNFITAFYGGWRFPLGTKFNITPLIGGGVILQDNKFTGAAEGSAFLVIPFAGVSIDFEFLINHSLGVGLIGRSMMEIESYGVTFLNTISLDVKYKL